MGKGKSVKEERREERKKGREGRREGWGRKVVREGGRGEDGVGGTNGEGNKRGWEDEREGRKE